MVYGESPAGQPVGERQEPVYAPVSLSKFFVLYTLTFGFYALVWSYRNWRYVKARDASDIWPFWRAVFAPISYWMLITDLQEKTDADVSHGLVIAWFLLTAITRLPDPYWIFWFASILALVPTLTAVNRLNREQRGELPAYARWRMRDAPVVMLGAGAMLFMTALAFQIIPSSMVQTGREIPRRYQTYLRGVDLLRDGDTVLFFYSGAPFSITTDGTVLTNRGLGTYWIDPATGERQQYFAAFEEITNVEWDWSQTWIEETAVRVTVGDTLELSFGLSGDAGRDAEFVDALRERGLGAPPVQRTR